MQNSWSSDDCWTLENLFTFLFTFLFTWKRVGNLNLKMNLELNFGTSAHRYNHCFPMLFRYLIWYRQRGPGSCNCLKILLLGLAWNTVVYNGLGPSSIYSWTISHILEHEFFCLGGLGSSGSKEKKWIWVFLRNFWGRFFQLFVAWLGTLMSTMV